MIKMKEIFSEHKATFLVSSAAVFVFDMAEEERKDRKIILGTEWPDGSMKCDSFRVEWETRVKKRWQSFGIELALHDDDPSIGEN